MDLFTKVILQNANVDLPTESRLEEIFIPTFVDFSGFFSSIGGPAASVFSFLAFFGALATVAIGIFWIAKIVGLGIEGIQSEGKPEKIQELIKGLQSIFLGAFMSFLFPAILSVVGVLVGIGTIFEWPRMFRDCSASTEYGYYFQAFLAVDSAPGVDVQAVADSICGY